MQHEVRGTARFVPYLDELLKPESQKMTCPS